jgi:general secretion pathway protein F
MPIFTYKGYDSKSGATRKGKVEADSMKAARARLRQKEHVIVSEMKEETSLDKARKTSRWAPQKVGLNDLAIMTRQFATLQTAHVPLDECLKALTQQVDNMVLRNTLSAVKDKVSEGISLADATAAFPGVFSKLYINMVRAGESSGSLAVVLSRLADFIEDQNATKGKILSAMTYPAVMIMASGGIIIFLFVRIVPGLVKVFDSLRVTIPWYTKFSIGISAVLQNYWYLLIMGAALGYFGFKRWVSTKEGRQKFDQMTLRLPIFGGIIMRVMVSRFTKTLSTLLNSGVPIIQALDITRNVITNVVIADVIEQAKIAVQEGQSLGRTIEVSGKFPPLVTHMIMTGERTGRLEEMLNHVAVAYDAEVDQKIAAMISLIEPIMIVVMGGITVLVVFSLLMPMLGVMNQLR